jgi:glycosyltransferase involved in cell wall biosynthesis
MAKVRLAHIVNQLYYAGKEAGIVKISSGMDKSLFDIDISVLGKVHRDEKLEASGIKNIELNKKPGNDPKIVFKLAQLFRRNRYHIIYSHAWNTLLEGYVAARLAQVPVKIHGEHGTFERSRLKDKVQPLVWERFDAITTVAGDLKERMAKIFSYRKDNIRVVYNGIDASKFFPSPELRESFRHEQNVSGNFVIGTVGRFHPVKDHFTLMEGFAIFRKKVPEAKLLLVGGEKNGAILSSYSEKANELNLHDAICFLPTTANIMRVFNGFDVFALTSLSEGCSNVILEAMACGVPVVATHAGGNSELIRDNSNGLLFEVGDAQELAQHLFRLYQDEKLRRQFQKTGPSFVQKKFTLEKTVQNYQKLYLSLLKNSHFSSSFS